MGIILWVLVIGLLFSFVACIFTENLGVYKIEYQERKNNGI